MDKISRDRILFRLPERYFQNYQTSNGFRRATMVQVLITAFNMQRNEVNQLMDRHPGGFNIMCRPSQFGRFIVLRCDANEGINGIKDLIPKIVQEAPPSRRKQIIDVIRSRHSMATNDVCAVIGELENMNALDGDWYDEVVHRQKTPFHIDVSTRSSTHCGGTQVHLACDEESEL